MRKHAHIPGCALPTLAGLRCSQLLPAAAMLMGLWLIWFDLIALVALPVLLGERQLQ